VLIYFTVERSRREKEHSLSVGFLCRTKREKPGRQGLVFCFSNGRRKGCFWLTGGKGGVGRGGLLGGLLNQQYLIQGGKIVPSKASGSIFRDRGLLSLPGAIMTRQAVEKKQHSPELF